MEWFNLIIGAVGTIFGMIGGGVGVFYWKANKALKEAEANKSKTEAKLAEADLADQILERYEKVVLARMDSGEAVRRKEFSELTEKIDRRFDVIEKENRKQNETLRDVVEYLNGDFQKFEEKKRTSRTKK